MDCRSTGQARSGAELAPPHETAFSSTGRGGKSMTSTSGDTFPRQAGGRVCFGRRPRYPPWPAGGVRAQIYPRDALFFDGQGEKLISSARQHHDTFFSSTDRGTSPSGALFLGRQGEKSIASAQQETFLDRQEGKCVLGAASARRQ